MTPDYNYHNTPEHIQTVVDGLGGWAAVLTFCQTENVTVVRGEDHMEMCRIVRDGQPGYYSAEMDALSAIVMGIWQYKQAGR